MITRRALAGLAGATLVAGATQANAAGFSGSSSNASEPPTFPPDQVVKFAKKVERAIAAKGARLAIVGRVGRDPKDLPEGLHFSHVAFAVYSEITMKDGRKVPGYEMWNLYQDDGKPDVSHLEKDFPPDFFASVAVLEAGVLIPSAELQARILAVINSPSYARLHDPHYSVIANPFTLGRQNCTEFVLDVVNAAIYRTDDSAKLKAIAKQYFTAQPIKLNPFKLLLGSMFIEEVSMADQTTGETVTATFERIADYLAKYDKGSEVMTLRP